MTKTLSAALALLARREHGAKELVAKLAQKGHAVAEVIAAVGHCQRQGLQSDQRFIESIYRVRTRQGYGPDRILRELQQKQVDADSLAQVLAADDTDWVEQAVRVLQKKYKSLALGSYLEQQKQKQFLLYRGFSNQTIAQVFQRIKCGELETYE